MKEVRLVFLSIPPSANVLKRAFKNPHAYARLRDRWKRDIWYSVGRADRAWLMAMADLKKRMRVRITIVHKKEYDKDNAYGGAKVVLDAIKILGFIWDDSLEAVDYTVDQEKQNTNLTRITIGEA